jgi:hypothetical protein
MTSPLLLVFLPSYLPCLRQHILSITPGIGFLGNPFHHRIRLIPALPLTTVESLWWVTPFLMLVLRRFRAVLFTGFLRGEPWSANDLPGPYPAPFGQADNPRRLVFDHDDSNAHSLALPMTACSQGFPDWISGLPAFLPALRIDDQSLPQG